MKSATLILAVVLLLVVSLPFAGDKISIDDIYGTWVNSDYNETAYMAKVIDHLDGTYELFARTTDAEPTWTAKKTMIDSWYDKEGILWVKCTWFFEIGHTSLYYGVFKFSDSGKVRESVWSQVDYPEEMSPVGGTYMVHYRQE